MRILGFTKSLSFAFDLDPPVLRSSIAVWTVTLSAPMERAPAPGRTTSSTTRLQSCHLKEWKCLIAGRRFVELIFARLLLHSFITCMVVLTGNSKGLWSSWFGSAAAAAAGKMESIHVRYWKTEFHQICIYYISKNSWVFLVFRVQLRIHNCGKL